MRCIFCKKDSGSSRSVEHIIPESLGNTTAILPPGVVCDKCNNYFSREVERPFLGSKAVAALRFDQRLPSKKGRVPSRRALLAPEFPVTVHRHLKGPFVGSVVIDDPRALRHILTAKEGTILFSPEADPPPELVVSRFLAKAALESLTERCMKYPGGSDYVVDEPQFDMLRRHAREGYPLHWPHYVRRIYDANRHFIDDAREDVQTIWEFDFLYTPQQELYFVLALFGLELTINVGGPELEGYLRWMAENDNASPLYPYGP